MGCILGIDYGERRIGIAVSDEMKIISMPLRVHTRIREGDDVDAVLEVCGEREVETIVIGQPLNMDGSKGEAVEKVEEFIGRLSERTGLPVELWDERMSSLSAKRVLLEGNMSRRKRKGVIDKIAAQIILQSYLDSL